MIPDNTTREDAIFFGEIDARAEDKLENEDTVREDGRDQEAQGISNRPGTAAVDQGAAQNGEERHQRRPPCGTRVAPDRDRMRFSTLLYGPLTPLYDLVCGAWLQPGRRRALSLLNPLAGERILEVGVGTGYAVNSYPSRCHVVAIDLSHSALVRAVRRVDHAHLTMIAFAQMDAAHLAFPSGSFDAVYVPHTINCVPDPIAVGRELQRVCAPNGRLVFLNHFAGIPETSNLLNRWAGKIAQAANVDWHLRLDTFLAALQLRVMAIESVNVPRLSSVVVCEKAPERSHQSPGP